MTKEIIMQIKPLLKFLRDSAKKTRDILRTKNAESLTVEPRRYLGEELSQLVGVPQSTLNSAEQAGRIPKREKNAQGRKLGYTLDQVVEMQKLWGTSPQRQPGDEPVTIAFTAFKGGCWKTNTTWYAGSCFANKGLRVLLVDLDPQASLSENTGQQPDINVTHDDTLAGYIVRGEDYPYSEIPSLIRKTYLPNMDIIPSSTALASCEMKLNATLVRANGDPMVFKDVFSRVRQCLAKVKEDYDIILIDGTPSLGVLPLNIIFGCDAIVVPTPTELIDFASTGVFNELYYEQVDFLAGVNNSGLVAIESAPDIFYLPTRYSASDKNKTMSSASILEAIHFTYGSKALKNAIRKHESAVSNLTHLGRTIFDVNAGQGKVSDIKKDAIIKARENFNDVFEELLDKVILPRWPSRQTQPSLRVANRGSR